MAKRKIIRLTREQLEHVILDYYDVEEEFGTGTEISLNTQIFTSGCCDEEKVLFSFDITEVIDKTLRVDENR
jgi:hypothetical protein